MNAREGKMDVRRNSFDDYSIGTASESDVSPTQPHNKQKKHKSRRKSSSSVEPTILENADDEEAQSGMS